MQPALRVCWSANGRSRSRERDPHGDGSSAGSGIEATLETELSQPLDALQAWHVLIICWRGSSILGRPLAVHGPSSRRWGPPYAPCAPYAVEGLGRLSVVSGPETVPGQGPHERRYGRTSEAVGTGSGEGGGAKGIVGSRRDNRQKGSVPMRLASIPNLWIWSSVRASEPLPDVALGLPLSAWAAA